MSGLSYNFIKHQIIFVRLHSSLSNIIVRIFFMFNKSPKCRHFHKLLSNSLCISTKKCRQLLLKRWTFHSYTLFKLKSGFTTITRASCQQTEMIAKHFYQYQRNGIDI